MLNPESNKIQPQLKQGPIKSVTMFDRLTVSLTTSMYGKMMGLILTLLLIPSQVQIQNLMG